MITTMDRFFHYMKTAYQLQEVESPRQCPRGKTSAIILDANLRPIATGRNILPESEPPPCKCDDGADTLVEGSKTCKAIHAEMNALQYLEETNRYGCEVYLLSTRPPCKHCLAVLLRTNVSTIVTTTQYHDRDGSQEKWRGEWIVLPHSEMMHEVRNSDQPWLCHGLIQNVNKAVQHNRRGADISAGSGEADSWPQQSSDSDVGV